MVSYWPHVGRSPSHKAPTRLMRGRGTSHIVVKQSSLVLVVLVLSSLLSGCFGDDDAPVTDVPDMAEEARATEQTGSITGQVITVDLEVLLGATVRITNGTTEPLMKTTDQQGRYTFNDLAPGKYRLEFTAICCKIVARQMDVLAGQVTEVNVQLERLNPLGLGKPYTVQDDWQGFIACGFAVGATGNSACGSADANHNTVYTFEVTQGLEELVLGVTWDAAATSVGNNLRIALCNVPEGSCHETYVKMMGPPPLVAFVNDDFEHRTKGFFANFTGTMPMRLTIEAGDNNVVYQQSVNVYWHAFYNQRAPADFNPFPDG